MAAPLIWGLGHILAWVLSSLVFKIIAAFGVGFVVMTGTSALINGIFSEIQAQTVGADANVLAVLGMLRIDDAITVLASAISVRIAMKTFGVAGGNIRQLVFGKSPESP